MPKEATMKKQTIHWHVIPQYTWADNYNEDFPYDIVPRSTITNGESTWHVATTEVPVPTMNARHVKDCQIKGLEECIKDARAESYTRITRLEEKLASLLALPNLEESDEKSIG
jgi:hypothetical protein